MALTEAEAQDSVRRFLPAFEAWAGTVRDGRWPGDALLELTLDAARVPTGWR